MKIFRSLCISLLAINSLSFYSNNSKFTRLGTVMAMSTYKAIRGDGNGGNGLVIIPSDGNYDSVVVFMHGLGDRILIQSC